MTPKRLLIFFGISFLFLICANYYSQYTPVDTVQDLNPPKEIVEKTQPQQGKVVRDAEYEKALAEKMAKKGIMITPPGAEPKTEAQWESKLREDFDRLKVFELEHADEAVEEMQTTTEEHEKKMDKLDEHMGIVQEQLKEDPFNERAQKMLDGIYQLKAIGKILKDKVIMDPGNFSDMSETIAPINETR
jgi:hypothetical protein